MIKTQHLWCGSGGEFNGGHTHNVNSMIQLQKFHTKQGKREELKQGKGVKVDIPEP
jgi:hypothetical protein